MSGRQSGKCVHFQQMVEIMDTKTGNVEKITIGDFFQRIKNSY
jgi:hypothetical protein